MEHQNFTKVVRIGVTDSHYRRCSIFCKIECTDGRLSITGVEGPKANGNCTGGCGQIVMHEWDIMTYAPGWDDAMVAKFREVWNEWHLNDMNAGSPAQRAWLKEHPIKDAFNHYNKACDALLEAGLNPDPNYMHNGKPYRYGSAWLREEVPQGVLQWLQSLPDTDVKPAWV